MSRRKTRPGLRLRWKLAFSYTLVTVAVLVTLGVLVGVAVVFANSPSDWLDHYGTLATSAAAGARPFLEAEPVDRSLLDVWLPTAVPDGTSAVVAPSGEVLAANGEGLSDEDWAGGAFADRAAPEDSESLVIQALQGHAAAFLPAGDSGLALAAAPVLNESGEVLGAVYVRGDTDSLVPGPTLNIALAVLAAGSVAVTAAAGLVGILYGGIASRGLVRRLERLNSAAQAWGRGDFSATVRDRSPDEIGQLARAMSVMADQIQELLQARQGLAALNERNRLARDLHDSVKQQAFATTMTLGTAKSLQQRDPEGAWQKVDEAIGLSTQVQQELDGLIYQLRPVALDGAGLGSALHGYVERWSRQTGIEARVDARGEGALPPRVQQTLFRVAQEALANVSRHSGAGRVAIKLISTRHIAMLEVADDGRGFDSASVAGKGMGLATMRERIEDLDGTLTIDSAPGQGTRVLARCRLGSD